MCIGRRFACLSSVCVFDGLIIAEENLAVTFDFRDGLVLEHVTWQLRVIRTGSFFSRAFLIEESERQTSWFEDIENVRDQGFVGGEGDVCLEACIAAVRFWGDMDCVVHIVVESIHRITAGCEVEFVTDGGWNYVRHTRKLLLVSFLSFSSVKLLGNFAIEVVHHDLKSLLSGAQALRRSVRVICKIQVPVFLSHWSQEECGAIEHLVEIIDLCIPVGVGKCLLAREEEVLAREHHKFDREIQARSVFHQFGNTFQ